MSNEIELNHERKQTVADIKPGNGNVWRSRDRYPDSGSDAEWLKWSGKLVDFAKLEKGWDSYDAVPPSTISLRASEVFLELLFTNGMSLSRLSPSVVGGVAFTLIVGPRMVFVEFRNTGNTHAAFTDDLTDDKIESEVMKVRQDSSGYAELIAKAKSHLNEQTALRHED